MLLGTKMLKIMIRPTEIRILDFQRVFGFGLKELVTTVRSQKLNYWSIKRTWH